MCAASNPARCKYVMQTEPLTEHEHENELLLAALDGRLAIAEYLAEGSARILQPDAKIIVQDRRGVQLAAVRASANYSSLKPHTCINLANLINELEACRHRGTHTFAIELGKLCISAEATANTLTITLGE